MTSSWFFSFPSSFITPAFMKIFRLALAGLCVVSSAFAVDLKQSKFTQVINDVKVISMPEKNQKLAAVNEIFKLPDLIRTGPASRAELVADDKTITRVGANTIFSFDAGSRTLNLEKGSILFHAPKGKGGGTIKTGNATAAVLGTTIMVGATPDGGFKVVVLEGTAKVKLKNGQTETLQAGQMVFVLPGDKLSPVITFRLDFLVAGSQLVNGFDHPLPSSDLINIAIEDQKVLIEKGGASDTGLLIGDTATTTGPEVVDPNILPPNFDHATFSPAALGLDAIIDSPNLDVSHLFLTPTPVSGLPFSGNFVGFFARNISFVDGSQTVDLTPYHSLPAFTFLASGNIDIQNSVHFTGNSESYGDLSLIAAGTITIAPESTLTYYGSGFFIQALGSMSFNAVTFQNYNGVMDISSGGGLTLKQCSVLGYGTSLSAVSGVSIENSYISGYGSSPARPVRSVAVNEYGEIKIAAGGSVSIKDSSFDGNNIQIVSNHGNVTANNSSFYGSTLLMHAANQINVNNTYLSFNTINMAAKTIILENIDFASYANVYLQSQIGQLAANPNTGAAPVAGYVNFIKNVTYGGDPAQNHVNPSFGTGIFIYPIGQPPPTQGSTGTVARVTRKIK